MTFGQGVHLVFRFGSPLSVGFDGAEDSYFVVIDKMARMNPFAPILVGINSAGVLESDAEGGWLK